VITTGDGKENLEDFHDLIKQLDEEYEPVGIVEESLVQTIAICWWRKARVIRAENGEIRKRLDTLAEDRAPRNSEKARLDLEFDLALSELDIQGDSADPMASPRDRCSALQEKQIELRRHPAGRAYLSQLLQKAKSEIARDGSLSLAGLSKLFNAFYFGDYPLVMDSLSALRPEDRPSDKVVDQQTEKKRIAAAIVFLDNRLEEIRTLQANAIKRESLAGDAEARSFGLPPADVTDKLLRYESHLDRQLYRAMDQLERLQRLRRGEHVPPPLNINLGRRV
jgi:hypothetical protein